MGEKESIWIETAAGMLRIMLEEEGVTGCEWIESKLVPADLDRTALPYSPSGKEVRKQMEEYLAGARRNFTLPLKPEGTAFEKAVWGELLKIPYGDTVTYGEIARRLGKPGASRAVGMACKRNPIGLIIPCHRVIASGGKPGGYNGGLDKKEFLLSLEAHNLWSQIK